VVGIHPARHDDDEQPSRTTSNVSWPHVRHDRVISDKGSWVYRYGSDVADDFGKNLPSPGGYTCFARAACILLVKQEKHPS
jgi:hypothetical protein